MSWRTYAFCTAVLFSAPLSRIGAQAGAQVASAGARGAIEGTVLSDSLERPVAKAEVEITDLGIKATTDSAGNFIIRDVPAGEHRLVIRASDFALLQTTLTFAPNETLSRDFLLRPENELRLKIDKRNFRDSESARLTEFEGRRKTSSGHFLTRQDLAVDDVSTSLSNILVSKIPGLRSISNNGERSMATGSRGRMTFATSPGEAKTQKQCYVQIVIDNVVRYRSVPGEKLFNIDAVDPRAVSAVEFYTVAQTPLQFNSTGGAPCGTLVIWQSM